MNTKPAAARLCFALLLTLLATLARAELTVYPGPDPSLACDIYQVTVSQDDQTLDVFVIQNVSDWEKQTYFKHIRIYETLSYAGFSFSGEVTVEVTKMNPERPGMPNRPWIRPPGQPATAVIRPLRFGIEAEVEGNKARFTLDRPGQYSVEFVDGDLDAVGTPRHALMLFADPMEDEATIPDPDDKQVLVVNPGRRAPRDARKRAVVRFEPGLHELGPWEVPETVRQIYLAPGAFVNGALKIENRENGFLLNGRGTLSGRSMGWHYQEPTRKGDDPDRKRRYVKLLTLGGNGITVDGITLADSPDHTVVGDGSHHRISWVKVIGWKYNNDGIRGFPDSIIEHCFIRANDDAIWLYDDNLIVRDTVFWQGDNGACFQLGWRSVAARNVQVRDVDLIHTEWGRDRRHNNAGFLNLRLPSTGSDGPQVQEDFLFENITIETPAVYTIDLRMRKNPGEGGGEHTLRNFTFRNLNIMMAGESAYARAVLLPWSEDYGFENFRFENTRVNGVLITEENHANEGRFDISPIAKPEIRFFAETEPYTWKNPLDTAPHELHHASIERVSDRYLLAAIPHEKKKGPGNIEIWTTTEPSKWEHMSTLEFGAESHPDSPDLTYDPHNRRVLLVYEEVTPDSETPAIFLKSASSAKGPWSPVGDGAPIAFGRDPNLFIETDGRAYLALAGATLREVDLGSGTVVNGPVTLVRPNENEEKPIIPGNPVLRRKYGTWFLFWTRADEDGGSVHAATANAIWGPYRPIPDKPFYGEPGTLPFSSIDLFDGPDRAWWILTTQTRDGKAYYSIDRLEMDEASVTLRAKQTRSEQTVPIPARSVDGIAPGNPSSPGPNKP